MLIDPDGRKVYPPTKYVTLKGDLIADVDDGINDVFVVQESAINSLVNDLVELGVSGQMNAENTSELGNKYGFPLESLAKNQSPESAYSEVKGHSNTLFRAGYHTGYEGKMRDLFIGAQPGGSAYHLGFGAGKKDRIAGNMNTFSPEIKNMPPIFDIAELVCTELSKMQVKISPVFHNVISGDNLTKISREYNVTIAQIKRLNNIEDVNKIYIGDEIKIK